MSPELQRLVAKLPLAEPARTDLLLEVGRTLNIDWPPDYIALVSAHNGVEGTVGDWLVVLTAVEDLMDQNTSSIMEFFPGLVIIGGDGAGEALAIDRATHEILLVPWIGDEQDWLILGDSLTSAFQRMERGAVYESPHRPHQS